MKDSSDAVTAGKQLSTATASGACATNAFRLVVHGTLMNSCQQCHGGAQGSGNPAVAYDAAKARVNFANVQSSALINRASQAGHCGSCGTAFGANLASQVAIWGKAERGDAATCAEYTTASLPTNVSVPPFDLGAYVPANPNDTIVVQDGLNEFRATGGMHSLLVTHCAQCHRPGGLSSAAAFGVSDAVSSYRAAKPRANFAVPSTSLLYVRAKTPGHGGGCTICGDPSFGSTLLSELTAWANQENSGISTAAVTVNTKTITVSGTAVQTLSWNLDTEASPSQAGLAGAVLTMRVSLSNTSTWRFISPTIQAGSRSIRVKKISFILNDQLQSNVTSYAFIDTRVPANTVKDLATFPALMSIPAGGKNLKLEFEILEGE